MTNYTATTSTYARELHPATKVCFDKSDGTSVVIWELARHNLWLGALPIPEAVMAAQVLVVFIEVGANSSANNIYDSKIQTKPQRCTIKHLGSPN